MEGMEGNARFKQKLAAGEVVEGKGGEDGGEEARMAGTDEETRTAEARDTEKDDTREERHDMEALPPIASSCIDLFFASSAQEVSHATIALCAALWDSSLLGKGGGGGEGRGIGEQTVISSRVLPEGKKKEGRKEKKRGECVPTSLPRSAVREIRIAIRQGGKEEGEETERMIAKKDVQAAVKASLDSALDGGREEREEEEEEDVEGLRDDFLSYCRQTCRRVASSGDALDVEDAGRLRKVVETLQTVEGEKRKCM